MFRKVMKFVFIILWMGLIFSFSNDNGKVSSKKSDSLIIKIVETITDRKLSDEEKEKLLKYLVVPVRKGAHIGVYLILGLLIFSFVTEFMVVSYKSILFSVMISFLYACSDEIHQLLVPGRSGEIRDIILDTVGAYLGIVIFSLIVRKCSKNE